MKKSKQIMTACCLFISITFLFFITPAKAQLPPFCYVPTGPQTVNLGSGGCQTANLGTSSACNGGAGAGWVNGLAGTPSSA